MIDKINEIIKLVGEPYTMFDEKGYYVGCFRPIQLLYPDKPKYKLRSQDDDKNFFYGMAKIRKHCTEIPRNELRAGDFVATRYKDELHVALYLSYGKILHVFKNHTLCISRLKLFKEYKCFRVNND
jgi:hypothetical protein